MSGRAKTGTYEWINQHLYDRWQVLRRHKAYRAFCDKYKAAFNKEGLLDKISIVDEEEFNNLREKYDLDAIYHYETELDRDNFIDWCVFEHPFATRILFREEKPDLLTPLWDDRHIRLEVDISGTITDAQLVDEFLERVNEARELTGIKKKKPERITKEDLRICDLAREGKSIVQIIKRVWPEEYNKEWATSGAEEDKKYAELQKHYRNQGYNDWDERAYREAYGTDERGTSASGRIRLYMRVRDKLKRISTLPEHD
jgi:guanyl-specific ribonuclease Sa